MSGNITRVVMLVFGVYKCILAIRVCNPYCSLDVWCIKDHKASVESFERINHGTNNCRNWCNYHHLPTEIGGLSSINPYHSLEILSTPPPKKGEKRKESLMIISFMGGNSSCIKWANFDYGVMKFSMHDCQHYVFLLDLYDFCSPMTIAICLTFLYTVQFSPWL